MNKDFIYAGIIIIVFVGVSSLIPHFSVLLILGLGIFFLIKGFENRSELKEEVKTTPEERKENTRLILFKHTKYEYMKSDKWLTKRQQVLDRDNYECQVCGSTYRLEIHHLSGYDQIPYESTDCLITLCRKCHTLQHKVHGHPMSYDSYMTWNVSLITKEN